MSERKKHQPALDVDGQIDNLKKIGLVFEDEDKARQILNEVSYFRIIKAYSLRLKEKNGIYDQGVTFEQIYNLYMFNKELRNCIVPVIEDIEVAMRCRLSNYLGIKYGVTGYLDSSCFDDISKHQVIIEEINNSILRNSMSLFVKNYKNNYENGTLPIYAVCEVISFGTLSKLYKNMKAEDKKQIATQYGTGYVYLESWMESFAHLRNICAHYGRLYNVKLTKTPKLYKQYTSLNNTRPTNQMLRNNRLFGILLCMKHVVNTNNWEHFVDNLSSLFDNYSGVDISTMGFPADWKQLLLDRQE